MTINGSGSGSGTACSCSLGGTTYPMPSEAACLEAGGQPLPPTKGHGGGVCGGCGAAMAQTAAALGWLDKGLIKTSRAFLEQAVKLPGAKHELVAAVQTVDDHFVEACRQNTRVLGQAIPAFALFAGFVSLMALPKGSRSDSFALPASTYRYLQGTLDEMLKTSEDAPLQKAIEQLKHEFATVWRRQTVGRMRELFGMDDRRG